MAQDPDSAVLPDSIEADTCRICRGEASTEEPLFYPCKCSGSIKFVHQDCLMDWLSHSHKKHCELCKTAFRFTKLYHPHMPKHLPTAVFLKRGMLHFLSQVLFWCRGLLVVSVWLVFLPWTMRSVWRFMFWFADSGWARAVQMEMGWPRLLSITYPTNQSVSLFNTNFGSEEQWRNSTTSQPLFFRMARSFVIGATHSSPKELHFAMTANSTFNSTSHQLIRRKHSSILSDARFLRHLTRSVTFNRSVMDVLEGIIITLSVVIAFVLVFLIREWVIQQQPVANANANAGVVENDPAPDAEAAAQAGDNEHQPQADGFGPDSTAEDVEPMLNDNVEVQAQVNGGEPAGSGATSDDRELHESTNGHAADVSTPDSVDNDAVSRVTQREIDLALGLSRDSGAPVVHGPARQRFVDFAGNSAGVKASQDAHTDDMSNESNVSTPSSSYSAKSEEKAANASLYSSTSMSEAVTRVARDEKQISRPDMPTRSRSSLATGIQRALQEGAQCAEDSPKALAGEDPLLEQARHISKAETHEPCGMQTAEHVPVANGFSQASAPQSSQVREGKRPLIQPINSTLSITSDVNDTTGNDTSAVGDMIGGRTPGNFFDSKPGVDGTVADNALSTLDSVSDRSPALGVRSLRNSNQQLATEDEAIETQTWAQAIVHWFWGDIITIDGNDDDDRENEEHVVDDLANEEPFVPFEDAQPVIQQRDLPAAAEQPAPGGINGNDGGNDANNDNANENDAEAAEDAEDLEGILELIGMQGPILGLFQNAIFSTLLIAATIVGTVQLPYMLGRIQLVFLGQMDLMWHIPLHLVSVTADFVADLLLFIGGYLWFFITRMLSFVVDLGRFSIDQTDQVAGRAGTRLAHSLYAVSSMYEPSATLAFSMLSHASLKRLQSDFTTALSFSSRCFYDLGNGSIKALEAGQVREFFTTSIPHQILHRLEAYMDSIVHVLQMLFKTGTISIPTRNVGLDISDPFLAYWNGTDRLAAVLVGYGTVVFWAAFYVSYLAPLSSSQHYRRIEMGFVEVVQQAGGVFKVIFIISIEMILFPLFCGFLLDLALLPLFANSTVNTRLIFTYAAPWTSGFVHWFVGTCYMFHFALFVSMCRKIMRTGVLYFIRDPDDPTFHPVRDVLERNVTVQLRKIAFSAIVYGTLITVCLGGVVWSLGASSRMILPIRWTSSESEREFPLDILFFNFLTPLVVNYTKPADGLHAMYKWWFHRCARALSLSSFLFNEEHKDEQRPTATKWFLWQTTQECEPDTSARDSSTAPGQFAGRYARVPASDQIRIPKGSSVFVEVDEDDNRLDGQPEEGVHSKNSDLVTKVYIPPWFKIRIVAFVFAIWFFAAATGVSVTIIPLLFGRWVMSFWYSSSMKINDIYAFALGAYVLGGFIYTAVHARAFSHSLYAKIAGSSARTATTQAVIGSLKQVASIIYVYSAFAVGLPILLAVLLELYVLLPLHTFLGRSETHIVHVVQDWTLGILYVRIFSHFAMTAPTSAPARIATTVLLNGYMRPNARVATRAFILPALLIFLVLITVPVMAAFVINLTSLSADRSQDKTMVLRMAYPMVLGGMMTFLALRAVLQATARWRQRIKDEVYLIGERLHNFSDKHSSSKPGPTEILKESEQQMRQDLAEITETGHARDRE